MRNIWRITAVPPAALAVVAIASVFSVRGAGLSADRLPPGTDHAPAATVDASHTVRIVIDGTRFHPDDLTVAVGERVVWQNTDPFPHNIKSATGGFHSENLPPNATWQLRPTRRGTFEYVCTLHPGMKAILRVR